MGVPCRIALGGAREGQVKPPTSPGGNGRASLLPDLDPPTSPQFIMLQLEDFKRRIRTPALSGRKRIEHSRKRELEGSDSGFIWEQPL